MLGRIMSILREKGCDSDTYIPSRIDQAVYNWVDRITSRVRWVEH